MTTKTGGATIYQFPKGGRAGLSGCAGLDARAGQASQSIAWAACGNASYHEDAIRQAKDVSER